MSAQPEALRLAIILENLGWRSVDKELRTAAAELRRLHAENEALRKDAERWKMTIEISQDVLLRHPDCRKIPASVSAYMDAIHKGYDMTYAVDAAIEAAHGIK